MSKGLIVSSLGMGEYTMKRLYNTERATAELTSLANEKGIIVTKLDECAADIVSAEIAVTYAEEAFNAALINKESQEVVREKSDALLKAKEAVNSLVDLREWLRLRWTAIEHRENWINERIPAESVISVWCADYNETLSGTVGVIEVARELSTGPVIKPGGANGDEAGWDAVVDGEIVPLEFQGPEAAFYNLAILPCLCKFRPRYRTGILTAKDATSGSVTLTGYQSPSYDNTININQAADLTDVPFNYMTCDGDAFEVDDHVLVHFKNYDWEQPEIVGFVSNPRPCSPRYRFLFIDNSDMGWGFDMHSGFPLSLFELSKTELFAFGDTPVADDVSNLWLDFIDNYPLWVNSWTLGDRLLYRTLYGEQIIGPGGSTTGYHYYERTVDHRLDLADFTSSIFSDTTDDLGYYAITDTTPHDVGASRLEIDTPVGMAGAWYNIARTYGTDYTDPINTVTGGVLGAADSSLTVFYDSAFKALYPVSVTSLFYKGFGFIRTVGHVATESNYTKGMVIDFYMGELVEGGDPDNSYDYTWTKMSSNTDSDPHIANHKNIYILF